MSRSLTTLGKRSALIVLTPLLLLALWALSAAAYKSIPSPHDVFFAIAQSLTKRSSLIGIGYSLWRVAIAMLIAIALAIPLAAMAVHRGIPSGVLLRLVNSFRPIAPMAWIPIAILWLGSGDGAAIYIVTYAAFFPVFANLVDGIRTVDQRLVNAATVLGAGPFARICRVVIPAVMPYFLTGVRIGLASGWGAIIAAELAIGARGDAYASAGIGQMMYIAIAYDLNLNTIISLMLTVGIIALVFDLFIRAMRDRIVFWYQGQ
ncbi:ABC transporter permease [Pseudorhodoplanes sp.]|jgi:ABC-type nitrate/sulfonate/bicarbonate transport system permease component|uniref:ABC transporter permease n=1 Tax=Pseudorhodoplanes sp. TaxID=1934341 RepID=UPI003D0E09EC